MGEVKKSGLSGGLSSKRKKIANTERVNLDHLNPDNKKFSLKDVKEVIQRTNMELPKSEYFELKSYCTMNKTDLKDYVYNAVKTAMLTDKII